MIFSIFFNLNNDIFVSGENVVWSQSSDWILHSTVAPPWDANYITIHDANYITIHGSKTIA